MRNRFFLVAMVSVCVVAVSAQRRYDSSMKVGKAGYRVYCNNKSADKNLATITPVGFEKDAREVTIEVKGRIAKSEVDDLNNDGFPDLVIYVYSGGEKRTGTVVGVSSAKNEGLEAIYFPDITDDPKLKVGYVGYDEFSLMEGILTRRFPVYSTQDTASIKPTGMMRQIMYRVVPGDRPGIQKFKVSRSYEWAKQQ